MATTHYFDTANVFSYSIAKAAAKKAGMQIKFEHRPTCCKQYHFEITAEAPALMQPRPVASPDKCRAGHIENFIF